MIAWLIPLLAAAERRGKEQVKDCEKKRKQELDNT